MPMHQFKSYVCTEVEDYAAQGIAKASAITERPGHHSEKEGEEHVEVRQKKVKGVRMQEV